MHPSMIWIIFRKDLFDAIRDGRVLVALLIPFGLGLFYNFIFGEEPTPSTVTVTVALASPDPTRLPDELRVAVDGVATLEFAAVADEAAVRRLIADEDADVGIVLPAGFDAAVAVGASPPLTLALPTGGSFGGDFVVAALDGTLRRMAGQPLPATLLADEVAPAERQELVFDRIGPGPYFVVTSTLFLVAMVALFAVPIILTEEAERKTLDALVMVATYADVIAAKALVGLVYTAVAVLLMLGLTRSGLGDPLGFGAAIFVLTVTLTGFGLLMGGLFRNATQLNTWSSVVLLPFIAPVYAVGLPVPDGVNMLLRGLPTSQATRLAINALAGERIFGDPWLSYLVLIGWGVFAYGLVLWHLLRREG